MTDAYLTDDTELAAANDRHARAALALAGMIPTDTTGRVAALITAATVLIEREVGAAMAPSALMALVEPTIAGWQAAPAGKARH